MIAEKPSRAVQKRPKRGVDAVPALPERAIRPVFDSLPGLLCPAGAVGASEPKNAGKDAGLHRGKAGQDIPSADREPAQGWPHAFYVHGGPLFHRRFDGADEIESIINATRWGLSRGYVYDGPLTERGVEILNQLEKRGAAI